MPKISVIIPVYNTEKYLEDCLDSVLCQTLSDIEIICINDGSTDNSEKILAEYEQKDNRIKVITQKNSGVIVARNNGIQYATADLIYPLDSDDIIANNTLEKLFTAHLMGLGDIITSRVFFFGQQTGEMILPKPNKLNFCVQNCSVNAALFRKSDFIKSGGYDNNYAIALEDYDLWLNFIYRQNLRFYRVPEKLFFYRIKSKSESRNLQYYEYHKALMKGFYIKYRKMRLYKLLRNILKPLKNIVRFFYRSDSHTIKLFKFITIYKKTHYDYIVAIGAACFVPETLKTLKLRKFSGPFDWMFGSDVITRLNFVKNRFRDYFNYNDFEYIGENPDNGKSIYKNNRSGIVYNHDFSHGDFRDIFQKIQEKYDRRTKRLLNYMDSPCKILFVYSELGKIGDIKQISILINNINMKFSADIDLLYVNHNPNISLNYHTPIRCIQSNIIYCEYNYKLFPDELIFAKKQLKSILKKVVKR